VSNFWPRYFVNGDMRFSRPIKGKKKFSSLSAPVSPRPGLDGTGRAQVSGVKRSRIVLNGESALPICYKPFDYVAYGYCTQRENEWALIFLLLLVSLLASCVPTTTPAPETRIINAYATPATQPWLADVFGCAPNGTVINVASDPAFADISLRLGEPDLLTAHPYQIDTEEILVVTPRQSSVQNLAVEGVRELFVGQGDPSVQVWVYAAGEDVQKVFEQAVMQGRSVTTSARLATGLQQMSDTLNNTPNTIGILPRHWKVGDSRSVYTIPDVPVLALTDKEPQGAVQAVIACLQK
jgi:hypothetical protein